MFFLGGGGFLEWWKRSVEKGRKKTSVVVIEMKGDIRIDTDLGSRAGPFEDRNSVDLSLLNGGATALRIRNKTRQYQWCVSVAKTNRSLK
jgi:hypothetical protein